MNYVLFSVIGLFMFAITGIGLAEVGIEKADRSGRETATIEASADAKVVQDDKAANPGAKQASGESKAAVSTVQSTIATSVPGAISIAVKKVENGLFGGWEHNDDDAPYNDEDENNEDEDEGDEQDSLARVSAGANISPPPTPPTPQQNTSTNTGASVSAVRTFTMAEIAQHGTAASCYSAIHGSVYDLTPFVTKHPGGQAAIKSLCGIDGSTAFNSQHGGQSAPNSTLAQYKIGVVAN